MPQQGFKTLALYTIKQQRKGIAAQLSRRVTSAWIAGPAGTAQSLTSHTINTRRVYNDTIRIRKLGSTVAGDCWDYNYHEALGH